MAFKKEDFEKDADFLAFCAELVKPLETANSGLKADLVKLKEKAKQLEGVDLEKLKADSVKLEQVLKEKQSRESDIEKAMRIQKETHETEMKAIKEMLSGLQMHNRTLIVDDALKNELIKVNCNPVLISAAIASIKPLVSVLNENGVEVAKVGDKTIVEHVEAWSKTEEGKAFCIAKRNSGGNTGQITQQQMDENAKYFDPKSKDYNITAQIKVKKQNVELYNNLKKLYS